MDPLAQPSRRRGDAHSVAETLAAAPPDAVAKTFTLAGNRTSVVYACGCVAVDPSDSAAQVQVLECPTHAALQAKLRRRQSDRS